MDNTSVVPECDSSGCPFPANSEVVSLQEMFTQECQDVMRLLTVELFDPFNEGRIVIEYLETTYRVCSNLDT